jgi:N-methylhydantoinase B/oxoprolinase/acetone carboxylase alpha subunit
MDYTEAMLRREIAKIPDGDYVAEGFLDDDGRNRGVTLPLKVTVKVRGDGVEVDTTGSSAQVATAFNVPFDGSETVFQASGAVYGPDGHTIQRNACVLHPTREGAIAAWRKAVGL